jgi:ribosome-binding factor A
MAAPAKEDRSVRLLKVGERVRHVLSELLMRQEVHDDTLTAHHISITEVRMSPDLRQARVYAKPQLGGDEEEVLTALRRNTAYLQREVARGRTDREAAQRSQGRA